MPNTAKINKETTAETTKTQVLLAKNDQNLIWLDCEMTGLDPDAERLIEIAVVITGPNLEPRIEGPVLVIHQSDEHLATMGEWVTKTHTGTGLVDRVRASRGHRANLGPHDKRQIVVELYRRRKCGFDLFEAARWTAKGSGLEPPEFGGNPSGLAATGGSLYVGFGRGTTLGRLDPASGTLTQIELGHSSPGYLSVAAGSLWTTTSDGSVVRVDPAASRVLAAIPVPGTPADVSAARDGTIWVAEKQLNTLTRIDPSTNTSCERSKCESTCGVNIGSPSESPAFSQTDRVQKAFAFRYNARFRQVERSG